MVDTEGIDEGRTIIRVRFCPLPSCGKLYHTEEHRVLAPEGAKRSFWLGLHKRPPHERAQHHVRRNPATGRFTKG